MKKAAGKTHEDAVRILLVRHGRSELNLKHVHQYRETALSEHGRKEAEATARRLAAYHVGAVLSSRYIRAADTARIIGKAMGRRVVYTDLLNEWRTPSEIQGKSFGEVKVGSIYAEHLRNIDNEGWHYSDEENSFDLRERAKRLVRYLSRRKSGTVVAVTHAAVIDMLIALSVFGDGVTGSEFRNIRQSFRCDNAGITEIGIMDGAVKVLRFNDRAHIAAMG